MAKKSVFYSFHFDNDVMRVQLIRNMGVIEGDTPVSPNEWEKIIQKGDPAVEEWIQNNMAYKKAVVVLIGEDTYKRKWVKHEIKKGWNDKRAVVGIYIHNLSCPNNGTCNKGTNPFDQFTVGDKGMGSIVPVYNPTPTDAYNSIKNNIDSWIDAAIKIRENTTGTAK